jgi:hypothetical protein
MNTSGERVSDALVKLDTGFQRDELKELRDQDVETFLAEGEEIRARLQQITHGELHPRDFDVDGMRAWLRFAWTMEGRQKTVLQGVAEGQPAQVALNDAMMGGAIRRWMEAEGLSMDYVARELARRVQAGEPMPWDEGSPYR